MRMAEKAHRQLIALYGTTDGKICQRCVFLLRFRAGHSWLKCAKTSITRSQASDWRAFWQACGLYEEQAQ